MPGWAAWGGETMQKLSPLAVILAAFVAIFLLLPLFAVVPVSFTPARFLTMPSGNWSLRHYQSLIDNPAWLQSAWLSVRIAVLSSSIATALALAFSLGMWMFRPLFAGVLFGFVLLPMVAPPVVSAITLYFFLTSLSQVNDLVGYDTVFGVAIAHAVMIAPFAVVLITVALSQFDRRIDLAARGFGAGIATRIFRVILPNIKFGVLTAAFLAFVLSWEEIGVTLFITSVNAVTLPRMMWMGLRDNIDPAIAAISVVLIVIVITIILAKTLLTRTSREQA
jgi:putative spermidine/putrescine transport system permease protein